MRQSTKSSLANKKDQIYDENGLVDCLSISDLSEEENNNHDEVTQSDNSYKMLI